jgi:hypothetical protein
MDAACISIHLLELNELVDDSSQGGSTCLALFMATNIGMGYAFWMAVSFVSQYWYGICIWMALSFVFQGFNVLNDVAAGSCTECREREKIFGRQETRIGSIPYPPSVFERSGTMLLNVIDVHFLR